MSRRIIVTKESSTGRNQRFRDARTGEEMSRGEFVRKIERGDYKNYHVRKINGVKTPVSNPDRVDTKPQSYRVFLSYDVTKDDMVAIWRLQTLAATSGIHLNVPNPAQRADWDSVAQMIGNASFVIALLLKGVSSQVKKELDYAMSLKKRIIPIIEEGVPAKSVQSVLRSLDTPVFRLDSARPWEMYAELKEFLNREKVKEDTAAATLTLAGALIGLLLLQDFAYS